MESTRVHKRIEPSLRNSSASFSPLRRSIVAQNVFSDNDDEAERIARRLATSTSTPITSSSNKRYSLGLGILANIPAPQMAKSINECIKLSTENKINIKNAFSLEMIDFMTYMIKKQDDNMSNLQVASTSLDVSSKIYGFRVDSIYTKILKIVGGLDKQTTDAEQDPDERGENLQEDAEDENSDLQKKMGKKKKKARQKILSTAEALKGSVEIAKPMSMIGEGDLQTSDMLYQAMLPKHANSGLYQHLYNDVLVDVAESHNKQEQSQKDAIPNIEELRDLEICAPYSDFEFLGWSVNDEELLDASRNEHDDRRNGFQFDLDASIEEQDNLAAEPINYFDIEHDDDERTQGCFRQVAINENIVDARDVASTEASTACEYSFAQPRTSLHWAGSSYWKLRNLVRPMAGGAVAGDKVIEACMQAPLRKRKEIELSYDENKDVMDAKYAHSQSNKIKAKTANVEWSSEILNLPEDVHYDIARVTKLYLNQYRSVHRRSNGGNDRDEVANVSDSEKYNYNNPNDTSRQCDYEEDRDDNDDHECNFYGDGDNFHSEGFIGDNLVAAPKLANKVTIAYCLKAKKIDMRQLKRSIWHCLKSKDDVDVDVDVDIANVQEVEERDAMTEAKQFSNVYKVLPKVLSKSNAEALSVPLSFISLLHLANEKLLNIHSLPDMSDVVVEGS